MGRWSQYRHRGRGNPAPVAGYSIAAPVSGNWELDTGGLIVSANMLAGCPLTVDGVLVRWRLVGDPGWTTGTPLACGDGANQVVPCALDSDYEAQIAWATAGVQVSDWSASKTVTCAA